MVSHSVNTISSYCTSGLVMENGAVRYFPDIAEAIAAHEANMARA
jgi:capsular polysaccharide transport system ATP-binding protein